MENHDLRQIIAQFGIEMNYASYGEGHINDTYLAQLMPHQYILQRINHHVFKDPKTLMENIVLVTEHIQRKVRARGGDPMHETLTVVKTQDGKNFYKTEDGQYYRMYLFVDDTNTYQTVSDPLQFYNAARAFGRFQNDLADFPVDKLFDTIPNFHNTKARFAHLLQAIEEDKAGRKHTVEKEIAFALEREKDAAIVVEALAKGEIPLRVTHNDTKLNNVLFDKKTDEGICVVDLDTVMAGSLLYDFGDSVRFGASTAAEDETDLSRVECSLELFEAYTRGFLEELNSSITKRELELLAFSAKLLTYECGIRFLTDYLNGDTYFKIHYPNQNLDRCRTQFKLVHDMENKMAQMRAIVEKYK